MLKKLNVKLILLECIASIFLINGIQRLYMASQGDKYDALISEDWEKFRSLTSETTGQFVTHRVYWTLGIMLIGILVIGVINWKNKVGIINSILLLVMIFGISATGFFMSGIVNRYLNYFCGLFTNSYGTSFFIGGTILSIIGVTILWKTINLNKNTVHNII